MIFKSFHQLEDILGKVLEGKKYQDLLETRYNITYMPPFQSYKLHKFSLTTESNAGVPLEEGEVNEG